MKHQQSHSIGGFGLAPLKAEGRAVQFDPETPVYIFPSQGRDKLGLRGSLLAHKLPHNGKRFRLMCEHLCAQHDRDLPGRESIETHVFEVSRPLDRDQHRREMIQELWRQLLCVYEPWLGERERRPFIEVRHLSNAITCKVAGGDTYQIMRAEINLWGWR